MTRIGGMFRLLNELDGFGEELVLYGDGEPGAEFNGLVSLEKLILVWLNISPHWNYKKI